MLDWKEAVIRLENKSFIKSIFDCMGQCIYTVSLSDKLRQDDKYNLVNRVWEDLIGSIDTNGNVGDIDKDIVSVGMDMFKRPSLLFLPTVSDLNKDNQKYLDIIKMVWEKRDKHTLTARMRKRADEFKTRVIDKLIPV